MKKKTVRTVIVAVIILVIAVLAGIYASKAAARSKLQAQFEENMALGEKYLLKEDYDEAIVAFSKAIEIDPRQADSYLKLSEAYAAIGDYENAVSTLQKGYGCTQDARLKDMEDQYQTYLDMKPVLAELAGILSQKDRDAIWNYQKEDQYQAFISGLDDIVTYPAGEGIYLLIYPCGHCYYGTVKGDVRSGQGIWAAYDYAEQFTSYFDGEWSEDYPNGTGKYWTMCLSVPEDLFYYEGTWENGGENGEIRSIYTSSYEGEVFVEDRTHISHSGTPEEVMDLHPEWKPRNTDFEWYCYRSDEEGSNYARKNVKSGIGHACKGYNDEDSMVRQDVDIHAVLKEIEEERREDFGDDEEFESSYD